jgi:hypothetical protein
MHPILDTIMLIGFILFIAFILIGYSRNRMLEIQEEEEKKKDK